MTNDMKVHQGRKIDPEEAKGLDRAEMGVGRPTPTEPGVAGQEMPQFHWELAVCPWCGTVLWVLTTPRRYRWWTCWKCGHPFRI